MCMCVARVGAERGQHIPPTFINSRKLLNIYHGVCTGLLLGDKQIQHKTPDLWKFKV